MLSMVEAKTTSIFPTSSSLHECAEWTVVNLLYKASLCGFSRSEGYGSIASVGSVGSVAGGA